MKKGGKGLSVTVLSAIAAAAVGIGVVVALLAGYFLGHYTSHTNTTTVTFAAAPPLHGGPSQEGSEAEGEATETTVEEEAEPQEAEAPAGMEAEAKKGGEAEGKQGGEGGESGAEAAALATGKGIVEDTCSTCHTLSEAGATGTVGPNLDELKPSRELVELQVTNGGGGMPPFKGTLSPAEIEAVAEYVSQVAGTGNDSAG